MNSTNHHFYKQLIRSLICLLIALCSVGPISPLQAQAPAVEWQRAYGQRSFDALNAICQTSDGGYIAAGFIEPLIGITQWYNFWIIKTDAAGNEQWRKHYGGSRPDYAFTILQTRDGGYIVGGYTSSSDGDVTGVHTPSDAWILKLDASGNVQWKKCYGGSGYAIEQCQRILQLPDGNYMVAGSSTSIDGDLAGTTLPVTWSEGNLWLFKLDPGGNIIWKKTYGGSHHDGAYDIRLLPDGGFIIAGITSSTNGDASGLHGNRGWPDYWVLRIDTAGNILWQKCLGGSDIDLAKSIVPTRDGGFVVTGFTMSSDGDVTSFRGGYYDTWVVKLDGNGNMLWQKTLGGTDMDWGEAVVQQFDGSLVVASGTRSVDGDITRPLGGTDIWLAALDDTNGDLIWEKSIGGNDIDANLSDSYQIDLITTADSGLAVAGMTGSAGIPGFVATWDGYIVKLKKQPCDTTVTVHDTAFCARPPFSIGLLPATTAMHYTWNTLAATAGIHVSDTGTYWRVAIRGCNLYTDSFHIRHVSTVRSFRKDTLMCRGSIVELAAGNDFSDYLWNTGATTASLQTGHAGVFWRRASDDCRIVTDTFVVKQAEPLPALDLGHDRELCTDRDIRIGTAIPEVSYHWSTGETSCCIRPFQSGNYTLTISNRCESATDSVYIRMVNCGECLFAPDAFTPNNDGRNDVFGMIARCIIQTFRMNVYNRWGQQVFVAYHPEDRWDGTVNSKDCEQGTYFYRYTYQAPDGRAVYGKGDVTLIR